MNFLFGLDSNVIPIFDFPLGKFLCKLCKLKLRGKKLSNYCSNKSKKNVNITFRSGINFPNKKKLPVRVVAQTDQQIIGRQTVPTSRVRQFGSRKFPYITSIILGKNLFQYDQVRKIETENFESSHFEEICLSKCGQTFGTYILDIQSFI